MVSNIGYISCTRKFTQPWTNWPQSSDNPKQGKQKLTTEITTTTCNVMLKLLY